MEWLDSIEANWRDAVARWEAAVASFQDAIQRHWDNRDKAIALGDAEFAHWQAQLDSALRIKTAIEMLQDGLSSTSQWARETFGLSGIQRMSGIAHANGMGAIPLIPVAVIVGSIATVTSIIYALTTYNNELERKWAYVAANPNLTPAQVADVIGSGNVFTDIGSGIKSTAFWIVAGGLMLFFGPELLKRLKK